MFPQAKLSWIVEPAGAKLLENFSGIDEIIVINLKTPGFFNKISEVRRILSKYKLTFDLIFDFQGLLKSAILSYLLKSETIGFNKENLREPPARFFYKRKAPIFDERDHVIFKNIHLISSRRFTFDAGEQKEKTRSIRTGVKYKHLPPKYPPIKELPEGRDLKKFLSANELAARNFLILNVGGGWETKLLTAAQNIKILNRLASKFKNKYKIVVLWGNEKEKETAKEISAQTGAIMAIFFGFSDLIRFIKYSRLIITGDTLPMHIADMVETPSVGIFGPTMPSRNGSLLESSSAVYEKLPCGFCYKKKCGTITCLKKLDTEKIIRAVENIDEKHG